MTPEEITSIEELYNELTWYAEGILSDILDQLYIAKEKGNIFPPKLTISSRIKTLDSCLKKIELKRLNGEEKYNLNDIPDLIGIRIITNDENIEQCYSIGSTVMNLVLSPEENKPFKPNCDYIIKQKDSGYTGLHYMFKTNLQDKESKKVRLTLHSEIQIMTPLMAHFAYDTHDEYKQSKEGMAK
jgi:ppGpp synthetase/RelA/SpoT-type nucleotidyltranferase